MSTCTFKHLGGCWGPTDRAHVIPKRLVKQQFPFGAKRHEDTGEIVAQRRNETPESPWESYPVSRVVWDPRSYVPACRRHHGDFDNHRIHLTAVPQEAVVYADEVGLGWWMDKHYPRSSRADAA